MNGQATPVTIRGVEYPSIAAAAKAVGVTHTAVSWALKRGKLDGVGLGVRNRICKPISIAGRHFASQGEAAEFLGVHPQSLFHWKAVQRAIQAKTEGDQ